MLIHPWDAPTDDSEVLEILRTHDFGQLIAPGGPERQLPVVVPTHAVLDDRRPGPTDAGLPDVLLHLARPNPVFRALAENPRALFTVIASYVYVDAAMNATPGTSAAEGVPTSYYASVQLDCDVEVIDDPEVIVAILTRQLAHFEPAQSERRPVSTEVEGDRRLIRGIRGLRLHVRDAQATRAKLKFGGNKSAEHRALIADALERRGAPMDSAAAALTRSRPGAPPRHA